MKLNEFAAKLRLRIFDELRKGLPPSKGTADLALLAEARTKSSSPQMGTTIYHPYEIIFEFIYPDPAATAVIVPVKLAPPQRIVFMPVPSWVVENIWQGDIAGSYHFESDAEQLLRAFEGQLGESANAAHFEKQLPKRRE